MRFVGYIILGLALIITAITGQIENNFLPMLFPPVEYKLAIESGIAQGYGWPFPFRLTMFTIVEEYDWMTFIIDAIIIGLILYGISFGFKRRW